MHHQVIREILRRKIRTELRVTHQIANALQHIALGIKAKLTGCDLIAPFDATLRIQQHHPIRAGLQSRQNIVESLIALLHLLHALANPATHANTGLAPDAREVGHGAQLGLTQPAQQTCAIPAIDQPPDPATDLSAYQRHHALHRDASLRMNDPRPDQPQQQGCSQLRSQ